MGCSCCKRGGGGAVCCWSVVRSRVGAASQPPLSPSWCPSHPPPFPPARPPVPADGVSSSHLDIAPRHAGVVFGVGNTAGTLAGLVSVPVTGYLLHTTGSWPLIFGIAAAHNVLGAVLWAKWAGDRQLPEDGAPLVGSRQAAVPQLPAAAPAAAASSSSPPVVLLPRGLPPRGSVGVGMPLPAGGVPLPELACSPALPGLAATAAAVAGRLPSAQGQAVIVAPAAAGQLPAVAAPQQPAPKRDCPPAGGMHV